MVKFKLDKCLLGRHIQPLFTDTHFIKLINSGPRKPRWLFDGTNYILYGDLIEMVLLGKQK